METLPCSRCGGVNLTTDGHCANCGAPTKKAAGVVWMEPPAFDDKPEAVPPQAAEQTPHPNASLIGSLIGEYRIVELLGKGGFGEVYRARDTGLGRQVAIKLLPAKISRQPESQKRFKREAKAASNLNHPNICTIYHMGSFKGRIFFVMELVHGMTLRQLLRDRAVEAEEIVQIGLQIAAGLDAAHRQGIIHRDIKSANIILSDEGRIKILDFGLAKRMGPQWIGGRESTLAEALTRDGSVFGTIPYMSPEQLRGEAIDQRSDIFSFGVVLYELLTGSMPFAGNTEFEVSDAILNRSPKSFQTSGRVAARLHQIVLRMLQKDPGRRYQKVQEVFDELQSLQSREHARLTDPPAATWLAKESNPHNLPLQGQKFVGREKELSELFRFIQDDGHRLVTLVGPGGIGKTRLAIKSASEQIECFPDGVWFVPFAPVPSPSLAASAIAEALGFKFQGREEPEAELTQHLQYKHTLLVLDNLEHLLEAADWIGQILSAAPRLSLLVTSRERLNLQEEVVYPLAGLGFPKGEEAEDSELYSAVRLFVQRAKLAEPNFELTPSERPHVARICRLTDGMPLGIELAAAWVRLLSCAEIAEEIEKSIDFLCTSLRDLPERHRDLRAVFEHSWTRLREDERAVFRRLSVFRGGFNREAAQTVAGAGLNHLVDLFDKSLLRKGAHGEFTIHELLRQFGEDKLQQNSQEYEDIQNLHCDFYADSLRKKRSALRGKKGMEAVVEIQREMENIRRSWQWALEQGRLGALEQSIEDLIVFFEKQSRFREGQDFFERAADRLSELDRSGPDKGKHRLLLGTAYAAGGLFLVYLTRCEEAIAAGHLAYETLDRAEPSMANGYCHYVLGQAKQVLGDYDEAVRHMEESLAELEKLDDPYWLNHSLVATAQLYSWMGKTELAREFYLRGIQGCQAIGDIWAEKIALSMLAELDLRQGNFDSARARFEETLGFVLELNDRRWVAACLAKLGKVAFELKRDEEARRFFEKSLSVAQELGEKRIELWNLMMLGRIETRLGAFQEADQLLRKALRIAKEGQTVPDVLRILLEVAKGLYASGEVKNAVEILRLVLAHPSTRKGTLEDAQQWRSQLLEQEGADWMEAEFERGETWNLDDTIDSVMSGTFKIRVGGGVAAGSERKLTNGAERQETRSFSDGYGG